MENRHMTVQYFCDETFIEKPEISYPIALVRFYMKLKRLTSDKMKVISKDLREQ